ncbi:hypothetical protein [Hydrogenimonas urashimensis]|uniref:hypothetical protein n=1 Tax=Hydrogenimonas urashimensis TaxID=2740515 RepID=UPI0019166E8A|nr:hypothetical protein [Hydrogenimonas urashimensis]
MKNVFGWLTTLAMLSTLLMADELAEKIRLQNQNVVKAAAHELSKELPKRVDPFTRLTGIDADGVMLIYTFEIDAGPKSDDQIIKEGKERMRRNVMAGVCSTSQRFLKSGIVISYRYISAASKKPLFRFDVAEKDCSTFVH